MEQQAEELESHMVTKTLQRAMAAVQQPASRRMAVKFHYCNKSLLELATGKMLLQGQLPQVATPPHPRLTKGVQAGLCVQPHVPKVHPLQQSCIIMGCCKRHVEGLGPFACQAA